MALRGPRPTSRLGSDFFGKRVLPSSAHVLVTCLEDGKERGSRLARFFFFIDMVLCMCVVWGFLFINMVLCVCVVWGFLFISMFCVCGLGVVLSTMKKNAKHLKKRGWEGVAELTAKSRRACERGSERIRACEAHKVQKKKKFKHKGK